MWTASSDTYGDIVGYDVNFVIPGKNDVIVAKDFGFLFHPVGPEIGNSRDRVMVQVHMFMHV